MPVRHRFGRTSVRPVQATATGRQSRWPGLALLFAGLLGFSTATPGQDGVRLPTMGEPAEQTLSPREETRIGRAFMREVRSRYEVLEDPLIQSYVTGLGERLARSSDGSGTGFTFFAVKHPTINAFAAPGGYVGIHTGLITAVDTESQLAAVVAHEIAHVTQRHLARAFSSAERSSLPTAAGIIAAILLGGVSPQASQAALATTIAANTQSQINYTRSNEQEADRVGINFLTGAGYDPTGMSEVFDLLRKANDVGSARAPAYLSTHPLSEARIAEARDRALSLRRPDQIRDDRRFQLVRMRTLVLGADDPLSLLRTLHKRLDSTSGVARETVLYGIAVAQVRLGELDAAAVTLEELLRIRPGDFHYQLGQAGVLMRLGRTTGQAEFDTLRAVYPNHYPVVASYAEALLERGRNQDGIDLLKDYTRSRSQPEPPVYRLLAAAHQGRGDRLASLEALSEYHYLLGEVGTAIQNLRSATKLVKPGTEDGLRIAARLDTLERQAKDALQQKQTP